MVNKEQEECAHGAFVEAGLDGEHYTGATRWQHVAEEAQESGEKVRDVREGAWELSAGPATKLTAGGNTSGMYGEGLIDPGKLNNPTPPPASSAVCTLCGSWFGSLGLEPLADCRRPNGELCAMCYVCHSVLILRSLREVLADSGNIYWNVADSYIGGKGQSGEGGLKPKDLAGIPGRVVQALQEDGWWRRVDIIWAKGVSFNKKGVRELLKPFEAEARGGTIWDIGTNIEDWWERLVQHLEKNAYIGNSMPESMKDRPTRGYEMIYMLTKKAHYYTDMDAVREDHTPDGRTQTVYPGALSEQRGDPQFAAGPSHERWPGTGRNARNVWMLPLDDMIEVADNSDSLWTFPTSGFGWQLCTLCGTVYDQKEYKALEKVKRKLSWKEKAEQDSGPMEDYPNHQDGGDTGLMAEKGVVSLGVCRVCGESGGWGSHFSSFPISLPEHALLMGSPKDGIVLDPFCGTATALLAALNHGRKGIGFELSPEYSLIAAERLRREVEKREKNGVL